MEPMTGGVDLRRFGMKRWRHFAGIFLVYFIYPVTDLWQRHTSVPTRAIALVLLAGFAAVYLGPLPAYAFGCDDRDRKLAVLAGMSGIAVVYVLVAGRGGLVFPTYLSVAFVMLLPRKVSAPLVLGLAAAVVLLPQHVASWDLHGLQWAQAAPAVLVAIVMYAVRNSTVSNVNLYQARQEVAHLAAEQERLRIARDLHDLLGHELTTIAVKAELAARLATRDTQRASAEMEEVAVLARAALDDVRATVAGYREVSLVTELATAREVLTAAGMEAELPAAVETVPGELRELFGWVVREGVTNAVRHSRAARVAVNLDERAIEVVDDGVGPRDGDIPGSGLRGIEERAAAAGGRLLAGRGEAGGYRLRVEIPV